GRYGNIVLYCINDADQVALTQALVKSGYLEGAVAELVQMRPGFVFRDTFIELGYKEKERQRMIYDDEKPLFAPPFREGVTLESIGPESLHQVAEISHKAHDIRRHIEGYYDFSSSGARFEMAQKLQKSECGSYIKEASLLLRYNGEPAAICEVIDLP